ncbi:hypothetical protein [Streptomyces sp. NPDC051173]|uniref:hypothetical protein n=1 Tax=Streptomyces sp. NPDC051173 TaxID=3155164 RepID=UPI00344E3047
MNSSAAVWMSVLFISGMAAVVTGEAIGRHHRRRRIQTVLNARATAPEWPEWPEKNFLLGAEPLDDHAIADHAALGIHDLTEYLHKEAGQ